MAADDVKRTAEQSVSDAYNAFSVDVKEMKSVVGGFRCDSKVTLASLSSTVGSLRRSVQRAMTDLTTKADDVQGQIMSSVEGDLQDITQERKYIKDTVYHVHGQVTGFREALTDVCQEVKHTFERELEAMRAQSQEMMNAVQEQVAGIYSKHDAGTRSFEAWTRHMIEELQALVNAAEKDDNSSKKAVQAEVRRATDRLRGQLEGAVESAREETRDAMTRLQRPEVAQGNGAAKVAPVRAAPLAAPKTDWLVEAPGMCCLPRTDAAASTGLAPAGASFQMPNGERDSDRRAHAEGRRCCMGRGLSGWARHF